MTQQPDENWGDGVESRIEEPFGDDGENFNIDEPLIPAPVWDEITARHSRPRFTELWEANQAEVNYNGSATIRQTLSDEQIRVYNELMGIDPSQPSIPERIIDQSLGVRETPFAQGLSEATRQRYIEMLQQTQNMARNTLAEAGAGNPQADIEALATEYNDHDRTFRRYHLSQPRRSGRSAIAAAYERLYRDEGQLSARVEERAEQFRPAWEEALRLVRSAHDSRTDQISIPMEVLEQVDVDQINAIVENRRVHTAFGRLLQELGLGNEPADRDFQDTMNKAVAAVKALRRAAASATEAFQQMQQYMPSEPRTPADLAKHGHDTQWRILNLEDEVLETSEWAEGNDGDYARDAMRQRLSDWQLQGQDVYLAEYHRCRWVNLTTKVEREP